MNDGSRSGSDQEREFALERLVADLKRRNVFRVAAVYGVVGFGVIEAADVIFPRVPLPEWTVGLVVWLVLLGFPIALVLAWAFETTPTGVRRTAPLPAAGVAEPADRRRRPPWAIGLAGLVGTLLVLVGGWRALAGGSGGDDAVSSVTAAGFRPSLAVLPFRDLTQDEATRSFADGIHGDVLTQLYKLGSLKVISRTSVLEYRESPANARRIAEDLDVAHLVEGDVQRIGDRFRINLQLIDARADAPTWAESYEGEMTVEDLLDVQRRIAISIAEALAATLTAEERESLQRVPTRDLEAYEAYRAAERLAATLIEADGRASARRALHLLSGAIERDPRFAEAYALKSQIYSLVHLFAYEEFDSVVVAADSLSRRALEIVPGLAEGHAARALFHAYVRQDYEAAWHDVRRALEGRPGDVDLERLAGHVLRRKGDVREALEHYRRAAELAPRDERTAGTVGRTLMLLREYDEGRDWLILARDRMPDRGTTYHELAFLEVLSDGGTERARAWLDEAARQRIYNPGLEFGLPELEMLARRPEAAIRAIEAWPEYANSNLFQYVPRDLGIALAHRLAGDSAAAAASFEAARAHLVGRIGQAPGDDRLHTALGLALAGLGRADAAVAAGEEGVRLMPLERDAWSGARRARDLAEVYAMTGRREEAIDVLARLLSIPSDLSPALLRLDPAWDPLRDHPRFRTLVEDAPRS